jgi:dihydrodipicolinate synthase/N-acetylneuraminate lyase
MSMSRGRRRLLALLLLLAGLIARRLHAQESVTPSHPWAGIYATLVTPYRGTNGGIDTAALEREIDHVLRGKVQGLVILDSYGEGEYATPEERAQVMNTTVRRVFPKAPVIVGIQGRDLATAKQQATQARNAGASAVLVQFQANAPITEQQLYDFMRGLSDQNALPIFYDHCPARSGVDLTAVQIALTAVQIAHILALPNVAGIREGTINLNEVEEHQRVCKQLNKVFFSATALNLTQFMATGGQGAMCPEAALLPAPCEKEYQACAAGRHEEARSIQDELFTVAPILHNGPTTPTVLQRMAYIVSQDYRVLMPSGQEQPQAQMKAALNCMGVQMQPLVKIQLAKLTGGDLECVKATVREIKQIDWTEVELRVPPQPLAVQPGSRAGGMLLKTGAFQLGAGVGKDLTRSQWDGYGGFFP